jgi:hypothetical protein
MILQTAWRLGLYEVEERRMSWVCTVSDLGLKQQGSEQVIFSTSLEE